MKILISGASGLIGSALVSFLTSKGHIVTTLVRKSSSPKSGEEIFWNPESGSLEAASLEGFHAVVHLAGEPLAQGRWTPEKKKRILDSRIKGTRLLCERLSGIGSPPKIVVCASAVGYYGDTQGRWVSEEDEPGNQFVSRVCREWEAATGPAVKAGIRVVQLRIGPVLASRGGALGRMLTPFKLGLGGRIGGGGQYMSWVTIDDMVGIIGHVLADETIHGPVNAVAPDPVTNLDFTRALGRVLGRPTFCSLPAFAVRLLFGEMGEEVLLAGARVKPAKLMKSNYVFCYPELEPALRHLLGKET